MADWEKLGGEKGQKVDTSRFGRAMKLGKLATKMGGSLIKNQLIRNRDKPDVLAAAAMDNAKKIVEVMGEMKGAAMKVGQLLSADPDLVDPEFADALTRLQRSAPPMTFATVQQVIEKALDRPMTEIFRYFEPECIGSASIGQVHRGTLFDGRDVAVKVQYPGIAGSLEADLKNLGTLLKMGRVFMTKERAEEFVQEARDAILGETDYLQEMRNLQRFGKLYADWPGVRIPGAIEEHCRGTMLVMEFIEGEKFDDALCAIPDKARRSEILQRFLELYVHMFHEEFVIHADPHPGNFMLDAEDNIVLLDFGCIRDFAPERADSILYMLDAFWADDIDRLSGYLRQYGFGREGMNWPSNEVIREYHHLILEPVVRDQTYNYSQWQVHAKVRAFVRRNPSWLQLVPPAELLLYFRLLAGVKGLVTRVDADLNLYTLAKAVSRKRGIIE